MISLAKAEARGALKAGDPMILAVPRGDRRLSRGRPRGRGRAGISAAQGAASQLEFADAPPLARRNITAHGTGGSSAGDIDWTSLADPSTTTGLYAQAHSRTCGPRDRARPSRRRPRSWSSRRRGPNRRCRSTSPTSRALDDAAPTAGAGEIGRALAEPSGLSNKQAGGGGDKAECEPKKFSLHKFAKLISFFLRLPICKRTRGSFMELFEPRALVPARREPSVHPARCWTGCASGGSRSRPLVFFLVEGIILVVSALRPS